MTRAVPVRRYMALETGTSTVIKVAYAGIATTLEFCGAGLVLVIAGLPALADVVAFKLAYGAATGLLATPDILAAAMRDPESMMAVLTDGWRG